MRRTTLLALVLVASAFLPSAGHAGRSSVEISISAKTANKPVDHFTWLTSGKPARITGAILGGQAGTQVELQESLFPFDGDFSTIDQATTGDGGAYSFTAKPEFATRYRVVLVSDPTSASPILTVYVSPHWSTIDGGRCTTGLTCRLHVVVQAVYPPTAAKHEAAKPAYFYFGVRYGSQTIHPTRLRLVGTASQVAEGGYRYRATFSFTFSTAQAYRYDWQICTKDSESVDGLGLPGRHHCGSRAFAPAASQGYLG